ncbi:MAG: homoserine kinase [Actinobacteria bacterium]|nr:homoserine kinase [Actinomycetota bacterium]MCB9413549.1 homoserine kinase [Actinomycetota bacterium]
MTESDSVVRIRVEVPATSANLGPGFDCLGLALELRDEYTVDVRLGVSAEATPAVDVTIEGEGADGSVPVDADNLVASALLAGLRAWTGPQLQELKLRCSNRIPHGRGLGSSSAAIVGGLALARELCPAEVADDDVLALATTLEGHPDNVAPAVLGGFTVSWTSADGAGTGRAARLTPTEALAPVLAIPPTTLSTARARGLVPAQVATGDAVFNLSRSALLVAALTTRPDLIFTATEDRLHQQQRAQAYPGSHALMSILRMDGYAATISGAGPTVLVLVDAAGVEDAVREIAEYTGPTWEVTALPFAGQGVRAERF